MQTLPSKASANSGAERRKSPRIPIQQKVQFSVRYHTSGTTHFGGDITDISQSGVFLISPVALDKHTSVKLFITLTIAGSKKLFTLGGDIVRVAVDSETKLVQGYGIRFESRLDKETLDYLSGFIAYETTGEVRVPLPEKKKKVEVNQGHRIDTRSILKYFKKISF